MLIVISTILYLIVSVLSVFILKKFPETFEMHYDGPKTYADYDDWDSNSEAAIAFSIIWPIYWGVNLIFLAFKKAVKLVDKIK